MFNWVQARKTFLVKAVMTLAEACAAYETEMMVANNRRKQQEICANLKEKVGSIAQPSIKLLLLCISCLVQY